MKNLYNYLTAKFNSYLAKKDEKENALFDYWGKVGVTKDIKYKQLIVRSFNSCLNLIITFLFFIICAEGINDTIPTLKNYASDVIIKTIIMMELNGTLFYIIFYAIRYQSISMILENIFASVVVGFPLSFLVYSFLLLQVKGSYLPYMMVCIFMILLLMQFKLNRINYNIAIAEGRIRRMASTQSFGKAVNLCKKGEEDI